MNEISTEILVAIIGVVSVIFGAIIGGVIAHRTNVYNNERENERFEQRLRHEEMQQKNEAEKFELKLEHENRQQLRKYKMDRLHKVLIPIIEIYDNEERLLSDLDETSSVEIFGDGIQLNASKYIEEIIEKNKIYLSVDLLMAYSKAKADYDYMMRHDNIGPQIFYLEQNGEEVALFLFDEKREFIKKIAKEAEIIESEYT